MQLHPLETPDSFEDFREKYPLLVNRLTLWAGFRGQTYGRGASGYVEDYINDMVISSNKSDIYVRTQNLERWDKLPQREKEVVARFFRFDLSILQTDENDDWYRAVVGADYTANVEPVIRTFSTGGKLDAAVTINSYGCHILNCLNMMIVDVDLDSNSDRAMVIQSEEMALHALRYVIDKTKTGWRIYQTAGGLRYIETTRTWDPTGREAKFLMQGLYADPLFVTLCRKQETFRARLTPKHWRSQILCGEGDVDAYFNEDPFSATDEAVCSLTASLGEAKIAPELRSLVSFHDQQTKAIPRYRRRGVTPVAYYLT
jgi:hypothetical protein